MPACGAKKRETKSQSSPGAVAITAWMSSSAFAVKSGLSARTCASVSYSASHWKPECSDFGLAPSAASSAALPADGSTAIAGKSIARRSPSRATVSGPLCEWNVTPARCGSSRFSTTQPEASVAWPHSGTSTAGVNQRIA